MDRREFLQALSCAAVAGVLPSAVRAAPSFEYDYTLPTDGDVRLLHITDVHAQLNPVYFREPHVNLGLGSALGKAPHVVGEKALQRYGVAPGGADAHALSYLGFTEAAKRYGKLGGFAHLATLVKRLRADFGPEKTLLLDGGDTWQGSATSLWTNGMDMVEACNELGVDIMTAHWEFTYPEAQVRENIKAFHGDFIAQNVKVKDVAMLEGAEAYDEDTGHAFMPYVMKKMGAVRVAVIGQAFPYTPIANPQRFIPNWTFGIREDDLQETINHIQEKERPQVIVLLSHNGMDVDLKLASRVSGIDVILGGHTHDGVAQAVTVTNPRGRTLVTNAGSNGKFVGVMDLKVRAGGGVEGYRYRLLPVFSNVIPADPDMQALIDRVRAPYKAKLERPLAKAGELLYRRGNFNGTFDQVICDALREEYDAQISLSPGFRWGCSVLPGDTITFEDVMTQTALTYPETYGREMSGAFLKEVLEDVCDNLFNQDAYRQQGGDMVRVGGLEYTCVPGARIGDRIRDMRLRDGEVISPNKNYKVAGWATVNDIAPGRPIWDVTADYLTAQKVVRTKTLDVPRLVGVDGNPGIEELKS